MLILIFNKTRGFPINKVGDFAKVLGVTPEYLLGFDLQGNKVNNPEDKSANSLAGLTPIDELEIQKMLEGILTRLSKDSYESDEAYNQMKQSLEDTLRTSKALSKNIIVNNKD